MNSAQSSSNAVGRLKRRLEGHHQPLQDDDRMETPISMSSPRSGPFTKARDSLFCEDDVPERPPSGRWKRRRASGGERHWDLQAKVSNQRSSESESNCLHFIQMLEVDTQNLLTELFWTYYNPLLQLTRRQLFLDALEYGSHDFYSPHLHLALLAMGLRYADASRADVRQLLLDGRETILHKGLKQCLDILPAEAVRVPQMQAFLLLADLEKACGRETTAWTYLHRSSRNLQQTVADFSSINLVIVDGELIAQRMLQRSCAFITAHWSLSESPSGRSNAKNTNAPDALALPTFRKRYQKSALMKDVDSQIHAAHLELLDLTKKLIDFLAPLVDTDDPDLPSIVQSAHNELGRWHAELDESLRWTKRNVQDAPAGLFLLHQQHQAATILLHRPFTVSRGVTPRHPSPSHATRDQFHQQCRRICSDAANRLTLVVGEYSKRFNLRHAFTTIVMQCSLAADVLVASLNLDPGRQELRQIVDGIQLLHAIFQEQASVFELAERVKTALEQILSDLGVAVEADGVGFMGPNTRLRGTEKGPGVLGPSGPSSKDVRDAQRIDGGLTSDMTLDMSGSGASLTRPQPGNTTIVDDSSGIDLTADCVFSPFRDEMMHIMTVAQSIGTGSSRSEHQLPEASR